MTVTVWSISVLFALPLDKCLVLASNSKHAVGVGSKGCTHHMLAMPRVAARFVRVVQDWVVKYVNEAPIIARDDKGTIGVRLHLINMSAIFTRWMHTLDVPTKFYGCGRP